MQKNLLLTIIFWLSVIFFLDPGGFFKEYFDYLVFGISFQLVLFVIAYGCFFIKKNNSNYRLLKQKYIKSYLYIIILWYIYYFFVFRWLNTDFFDSYISVFTRGIRTLLQGLIVFPIIYFSIKDLNAFVGVLKWSTIIILLMFLLTILTNVELISFMTGGRGYSDSTRYFMEGYGIIYFVPPIAISYAFSKFKNDKIVIIASLLAILLILVTITRRELIGIFEMVIIISFIFNKTQNKNTLVWMKKIFSGRNIIVIIIFLLALKLLFPSQLSDGYDAIKESYSIALYSETTKGQKDIRMSLTGKRGIIEAIQKNVWIGTGFNPDWNTGSGGKKGLEGSDYIFLSALGMYGIIGLLIFLPFYILVVRIIIKLIQTIKTNRELIYNHQSLFKIPVIIGIAASAEFIKNIIEYPNWFYPIGAVGYSPKYFIFFGLLFGSYYSIINNLLYLKKIQHEN